VLNGTKRWITNGSIADIATAPWRPWLLRVLRRHHATLKKDFFTTIIGQVAVTINSALVFDSRHVPMAFRIVHGAKGPRDVLRSQLRRYHVAVQREIDKWIGMLDTRADKHPEHQLIVYYVEPKFHIKSTLSTILSLKHPTTTLVLLGPDHDMVTVSARRHDSKFAMNELLECACRGIKGASAGGHIPAAGGRFPKKDLLRFRSQLLDCVAAAQKAS
ncbi:MAG: DHHA1 domain-containing protein, partial [Nanoarchaeota archaeon]